MPRLITYRFCLSCVVKAHGSGSSLILRENLLANGWLVTEYFCPTASTKSLLEAE